MSFTKYFPHPTHQWDGWLYLATGDDTIACGFCRGPDGRALDGWSLTIKDPCPRDADILREMIDEFVGEIDTRNNEVIYLDSLESKLAAREREYDAKDEPGSESEVAGCVAFW